MRKLKLQFRSQLKSLSFIELIKAKYDVCVNDNYNRFSHFYPTGNRPFFQIRLLDC